jgi:hypothetical protein
MIPTSRPQRVIEYSAIYIFHHIAFCYIIAQTIGTYNRDSRHSAFDAPVIAVFVAIRRVSEAFALTCDPALQRECTLD